MWARSRMPSPTSPLRLITGGASSPDAIGRSSSERSPSVRARKSTSTASSFAVTLRPTWRSAATHLIPPEAPRAGRGAPPDPAGVRRAGIVLEERLDVHVDAHQRVLRQAAQALVEAVL